MLVHQNQNQCMCFRFSEDAPDSPYTNAFEKGNVVGLQFDGIEEAAVEHRIEALGKVGDYHKLSPFSVMVLLNLIGGRNWANL